MPAGRLLLLLLLPTSTFPAVAGHPMLLIAGNQAKQVSETINTTWQNPSDTMTILLIIGGDVVLKALAQLSGRLVVPVAFSFGWVAYSFNTLMSIFGDGRLMPPPDYPAKLINTTSGFTRDNRSWVLGRLLRDHEELLPDDIGLCVTVYEASSLKPAGVPTIDWCWLGSIIVIALQLCIAALPCAFHDDWSILVITFSGTMLSLVTGALPQWRSEKWACRRNTSKVLCLTGGNGTRSVMVIIGKQIGLDLEDLAVGASPRSRRAGAPVISGLPWMFRLTQILCSVLAALWIVILITVTGLTENSWYLLCVGGLGMAQNVIVAGTRRGTGTTGIHLEKVEEFKRRKVMHALMDLEDAYYNVGRSLLNEFFSYQSGLRPDEIKWWNGEKEDYEMTRQKKYPDSYPEEEVSKKASKAREDHRRLLGRDEVPPSVTPPAA